MTGAHSLTPHISKSPLPAFYYLSSSLPEEKLAFFSPSSSSDIVQIPESYQQAIKHYARVTSRHAAIPSQATYVYSTISYALLTVRDGRMVKLRIDAVPQNNRINSQAEAQQVFDSVVWCLCDFDILDIMSRMSELILWNYTTVCGGHSAT